MTISAVSSAGAAYQAQSGPPAGPGGRAAGSQSSAPQDSVHLSAAAAAHLKGGDPDGDGD